MRPVECFPVCREPILLFLSGYLFPPIRFAEQFPSSLQCFEMLPFLLLILGGRTRVPLLCFRVQVFGSLCLNYPFVPHISLVLLLWISICATHSVTCRIMLLTFHLPLVLLVPEEAVSDAVIFKVLWIFPSSLALHSFAQKVIRNEAAAGEAQRNPVKFPNCIQSLVVEPLLSENKRL